MSKEIHTDSSLTVEERDSIFREQLATMSDSELAEVLESVGTFRAPNSHYVLEASRRLKSADKVKSISEIPCVIVRNENGEVVRNGYYFRMPSVSSCLRDPHDKMREFCISYESGSNWGLPNIGPVAFEVIPPMRLELANRICV